MTKLQFFYFPFDIGDEYGDVIPQFYQNDVRKLAGKNSTSFHLKIFGRKEPHASLIKINQVASFMEAALESDNLEWEYVGNKRNSENELIAILYLREDYEMALQNEESELHQFLKEISPLFDYMLRQISNHNLASDEFRRCLNRLGIKDNSNVLHQLISLRDDILLLDDDEQTKFQIIIESLKDELLIVDEELRSIIFSLLEDSNLTSARQVILLLELNYLFSLFLYGLSNYALFKFMSKIKSFLSSLNPDDLTKISLPFLARIKLHDDPYHPF
jgi:hypothetical protein